MPGFSNRRLSSPQRTATTRPRWILLLLFLCSPAAARATTADDLCLPGADPCVVLGLVDVDDGSIIDLGARTLRVAGRLDAGPGNMTLNAGRLEVPASGELRARGDTSRPGGSISVTAGSVQVDGKIDASGSPGGSVDITSDGELNVAGSVDANSLTNDELGGDVSLTGGVVNLGGPVTAQGGRERFGGDIEILAAGAVTASGIVSASGGAGGTIDISAGTGTGGGRLLVAGTAELLADATGSGEDGGSIDLTTGAAGSIEVRGRLSAVGRGASDGAGDGGAFEIDAAGDFLLSSGADITANGGSPDGTAGAIDVQSGEAMQLAGRIEMRGLGSDGDGGEILADAEGGAEISGTIDLSGGNSGGSLDLDASGEAIVVTSNGTIDTTASGDGSGGTIGLDSDARLSVAGELRTDGGSLAGSRGGQVDLDACSIEIQASGILSSLRSGGSNFLIGRDDTVIAGTLRADAALGRNQIRFPGLDQEPIILGGATVVPSAVLSADPVIQPCQPRTPSPTRTPTPTRTPGSTPTATPSPLARPCLGDCDSDGRVAIDELVRAVAAALAQPPPTACGGIDRDGNDAIEIDELVAAVAAALLGCG